MEKKEIIGCVSIVAIAAAALVGVVWIKSKKVTDAIRQESERQVGEIYRDMDRAMAEHVEEMARLEADRKSGSARHEELMTVLQAAREAGESLHLDRLTILGDLAEGKITSQEAIEQLRAMNKPEEVVAA